MLPVDKLGLTKQARYSALANASFCCERPHHCARSELTQTARQQQAPLGRGAVRT
jgi:hypothetical protein